MLADIFTIFGTARLRHGSLAHEHTRGQWVRDTEGDLVAYGYLGCMSARPGHRDDVVAILLRGMDALRKAGCELYVVSVSDTDPDVIWITEVWESKERHDASLELPETQAAIAEAMPMLTGEFTNEELTVIGGLGLRKAVSRV